MTELEALAKKLAEFNEFKWENCAQSYWKDEIQFILTALRTPSEGMWKAARFAERRDFDETWANIIDHILNEEQK